MLTVEALQHSAAVTGAPHDYRGAVAPRLGIAYAPGEADNTVIRAGFGMFYNDLAQNGWVTAFQAVNAAPVRVRPPGRSGMPARLLRPAANGALIDPAYKTPYALHSSAGVEHAFNSNWMLAADWTHEEGRALLRALSVQGGISRCSRRSSPATMPPRKWTNVPDITVFRTDNRSRYDGMTVHLQGNVTRRLNSGRQLHACRRPPLAAACSASCLITWTACAIRCMRTTEGDYGPSGEDVTHRFVLAGTLQAPGGLELSTL